VCRDLSYYPKKKKFPSFIFFGDTFVRSFRRIGFFFRQPWTMFHPHPLILYRWQATPELVSCFIFRVFYAISFASRQHPSFRRVISCFFPSIEDKTLPSLHCLINKHEKCRKNNRPTSVDGYDSNLTTSHFSTKNKDIHFNIVFVLLQANHTSTRDWTFSAQSSSCHEVSRISHPRSKFLSSHRVFHRGDLDGLFFLGQSSSKSPLSLLISKLWLNFYNYFYSFIGSTCPD
jgi:hypothetical protein